MISPERQLEIAKECGISDWNVPDDNMRGGAFSYINTSQLSALSARIEAEVIARMEPVYQAWQGLPCNWIDIDESTFRTVCLTHKRILYRLTDSKTEGGL